MLNYKKNPKLRSFRRIFIALTNIFVRVVFGTIVLYFGAMFLIHENSFVKVLFRNRMFNPTLLILFGLLFVGIITSSIQNYLRKKTLENLAIVISQAGLMLFVLGSNFGSFTARYQVMAAAAFIFSAVSIIEIIFFARKMIKNEYHPDRLMPADILGQYKAGYRDFRHVDLFGAALSGNDLSDIDFSFSDLSGTDMRGTNLQGTQFNAAILDNANLENARVTEMQLNMAKSLNNAIMPDGSRYNESTDSIATYR